MLCATLLAGDLLAQPTVAFFSGAATVRQTLQARGGARFARFQANAGSSTYAFHLGTPGSPDYSTNWRPYTGGDAAAGNFPGFNQRVLPTALNSARRNNPCPSFCGTDGNLPTVTSGNYYTLNVGNNGGSDNNMSVLETAFDPRSITAITDNVNGAVGLSQTVAVTVTLSGALQAGENLILRYSTDAFATNNQFLTSPTGTNPYTFTIPAQSAGTTISWYVFSSVTNATGAGENQINGNTADFLTLNLRNQSGENVAGSNFTYTVQNAITSINTGSWSAGGTWSTGGVPTASDNVIIRSGNTVTITAASVGNGLTVLSGGTLSIDAVGLTLNTLTNNGTVSSGAGTSQLTLNAAGSITNNSGGSLNLSTGTNTVVFSGAGSIGGAVASALGSLTISATVSLNTVPSIAGTLTISGGNIAVNSPIYQTGSTLLYNNGSTYGTSLEWTATTDGAAGSGRPHHVTLGTTTTVTTAGARALAGDLTLGARTLNATAGDFFTRGSISATTGDITLTGRAIFFSGGATQTLTRTGNYTFPFVIFQKTGGSVVLGAGTGVNVNGTGTDLVTFSSTGGVNTLDLNGRTFNVAGTGNINVNATGTHTISNSTGTGTFQNSTVRTLSTGTLRFSNAGTALNIQVSAGLTINNTINIISGNVSVTTGTLAISGSGVVNVQATAGLINAAGSVITTASAANLVVAGTGNFFYRRDGGTLPAITWNTNSTCWFENSSNNNMAVASFSGNSFQNVIFNHTQTGLNLVGATYTFTINGNLTHQNTGTTTLLATGGTGTLNVTGTTTVTSGSLTLNSAGTMNATFGGTVALNGGTFSRTTAGTTAYNATGTSLNINGGTFAPGAFTHAFAGDVLMNAGTFNSGTATVVMNIAGSFTVNTGMTTFNSGTGNYTFTGAARTIGGNRAYTITNAIVTGTYSNANSNASGLSIGTLTVNTPGTFTNDQVLNISTNINGSGTYSQGAVATSVLNSTVTAAFGITTFNANGSGNTVNYTSGAATTIRGVTYFNLGIQNNSAKTLNANTIITNNLVFGGAATPSLACANFNLNLSGSGDRISGTGNITTVNGVITVAGNFSGAAGLTISGTGNMVVSGDYSTSGALSVTGVTPSPVPFYSVVVAGNKINNGSITLNSNGSRMLVSGSFGGSGTVGLSNANAYLNVVGDYAGTGAITFGTAGATLALGTTFSSNPTLTNLNTNGTLYFYGNSPQTIKNTSVRRLRLKGADKTLPTNFALTVGDSLNIMNALNLIFPSNTSPQVTQLTLNGDARTNSGAITPDPTGRLSIAGTVVYNASPGNNRPILSFNPGTLGWLDINARNLGADGPCLEILSDLTVGRYNFATTGHIRVASNRTITIAGTSYAGFGTSPTGVASLTGNTSGTAAKYWALGAGARVVFTPNAAITIGTNMTWHVGFNPGASTTIPASGLISTGTFSSTAGNTAVTGTNFTNDLCQGDVLVRADGSVIGVINATSFTATTLTLVSGATSTNTNAQYFVRRFYRPVTLAPVNEIIASGSQSLSIGFNNHSGGGVTNGTNIAPSPSTRRTNYQVFASSSSASTQFAMQVDVFNPSDCNASLGDPSIFRTTGTTLWEKYRINAGFGSTGAGAMTGVTTFYRRDNIGELNDNNLFVAGQTGGDLPDDPTFTWNGTTSSWNTTSNWLISGSLDPFPNSPAHFVNIGSGGSADPAIPASAISVATISQNAKTLTVPANGTLNIAGQYALNFPTGLLSAGVGTITSVATAVTGVGTSFNTQLVPGSYLYRATDNLFLGIVRSVGGAGSLTLMNFGSSVGALENITVPTTFNYITRPSTPIVGTISVDVGVDAFALTITGGTFTSSMLGRVILDASNGLIGVVGAVVNPTTVRLVAAAPATYSGAGSIMDGIPTVGSGSLVCEDNSTVVYGSNISQMFAPASYFNVNFTDSRSLAATASTIWRVSFATAQSITIRGRMLGRYWVMHTPITGLTYQFLNGSTLDVTVPGYTAGGPTAGQLWRAYNAGSSHPNVRFGLVPADRVNFRLVYNRDQDLTFQGPEFSLLTGGRCGDFEYIKSGAQSLIVNSSPVAPPSPVNIIVNGAFTLTRNNVSGSMFNLGNVAYTPGNEVNIVLRGPITMNGTNPGGFNNNFGIHNFTIEGTGAITKPTGIDLIPLSGSGTTASVSNFTYNRPGITYNVGNTSNTSHFVALNSMNILGGTVNRSLGGNVSAGATSPVPAGLGSLTISGTGQVTHGGAGNVGGTVISVSGSGGIVHSGAGNILALSGINLSGSSSVTHSGSGIFGFADPLTPADVTISDIAILNLSANTNSATGHGTTRDWIQNGGTVTLPNAANSPLTVARNLILNGGSISKAAGNIVLGTPLIPFAGDLNFNNGTMNVSNANLVVSASGNQAFTSSSNRTATFQNVSVSKASGTFDVTGGKLRVLDAFTIVSNTAVGATTGNITLAAGPSTQARLASVPSGASVNGSNWTIEKYISPGSSKWSFLGTSVSGATVADFSDDWSVTALPGATGATWLDVNAERSTVFTHEEPLGGVFVDTVQKRGWRALSTPGITVGKGYRNWFRDNSINSSRIWDMTGTMSAGTINLPLTRTSFSCGALPPVRCNTQDQGWNLIANPYPSAVDWASAGLVKTGINNAFYTWQVNQYRVWGPFLPGADPIGFTGAASASSIIPSGQGFFVKVTGGSGNLQFNETAKVAAAGTFWRTSVEDNNRLFIGVENNGNFDRTWVRFREGATEDFDQDIDAHKLSNPGLNIASIAPAFGTLYCNTLPMFNETTTIPLDVRGVSGSSKLSFFELGTFAPGTEIFLKDNYLGTITAISEGSEYEFTADSDPQSQGSERFEIVFSAQAVTKTHQVVGKFGASVVPNPGNGRNLTLVLKNAQEVQTRVLITDMVGKVLLDQEFTAASNKIGLDTDLPMGVYQVLVTNGGKTTTQRVVVNR